jgi:phospholipid/cholesterol/gamma-HCH transport system substrate-binding protein
MRDARRNYVVVGSFVLGMGIVLLVWLAVLAGRTGRVDTFHAEFESVMGLAPGTQVLFQGYPVGLIDAIHPAAVPTRYRVELSVEQGWRIPEDSVARIASPGLLSAKVLDIRAGSSEVALTPGSHIRSQESGDIFDQVGALAGEVGSLTHRFEPMIESLSSEIPAIARDARNLMGRLDESAGHLQSLLADDGGNRVGSIVSDVGVAAESLAKLTSGLDETRGRLDRLLERVDSVVAQQSPRVDESFHDLQTSLDALSRHAESISHNLEDTSRNLNEFSAQLRRDPAVIVYGPARQGEQP